MRDLLNVGLLAAVGTGLVIGYHASVNGALGRTVPPFAVALVVNMIGGTIGLAILTGMTYQGGIDYNAMRQVLPLLLVSGFLGIVVVTGISFSFARIGVAAGTVAVILGQTITAIVVDTVGVGGYSPIPLNPTRILGLALLAVAAVLVLPKGD